MFNTRVPSHKTGVFSPVWESISSPQRSREQSRTVCKCSPKLRAFPRASRNAFLSTDLQDWRRDQHSDLKQKSKRDVSSGAVLRMSSEPLSAYDVDQELWEALDLCTDKELEGVHDVLFGKSPFSPALKNIVTDNEAPMVSYRGRRSVMHRIESRFRFLAADSFAMLKGMRPSYREALAHIKHKFNVRCPNNLSTPDLESEIFLHLIQNYADYMKSDSGFEQAKNAAAIMEGDGMSHFVPPKRKRWVEKLTAPLKFGQKEIVSTFTKLGGALTVSALRDAVLKEAGAQLVVRKMQYQSALKILCSEGVTCVRRRAAVQAAQKGLTGTAVRFSAVNSALSMLGPLMWAWLGVDLALKAIGTDYARIVKTVFVLAQVRLVRTYGFTNPPKGNIPPYLDA